MIQEKFAKRAPKTVNFQEKDKTAEVFCPSSLCYDNLLPNVPNLLSIIFVPVQQSISAGGHVLYCTPHHGTKTPKSALSQVCCGAKSQIAVLVSHFYRLSTLAEETIYDEDTGGGLVKLKKQGIMTRGFCLTVETNEIMEKQKTPNRPGGCVVRAWSQA